MLYEKNQEDAERRDIGRSRFAGELEAGRIRMQEKLAGLHPALEEPHDNSKYANIRGVHRHRI
jgi:hypothetical protein